MTTSEIKVGDLVIRKQGLPSLIGRVAVVTAIHEHVYNGISYKSYIHDFSPTERGYRQSEKIDSLVVLEKVELE